MSLYRRKDSRYLISEIQINGKRHRTSTGETSKRRALAFEAAWRTRLLREEEGQASIPLLEAIERYQQEELAPRKPKPATARKAAHNLGIIKDRFGSAMIEEVTAESISRWRSAMLGRGLAAATANRRLADLRAILRKAHKWGVLASVPRIDMVKQPAPAERYLTDREFDRLLEACPAHLKRLVRFLVGTGARLGEATALTWGQVDLPFGERGRVTFTNTKSGKSRGVPLPRDVADMLREIQPTDPEPSQRVFTWRRDDGKELPFDSPKTAWRGARDRAGLRWLRIHDLRHFYAARLVRKGVSLYSVQRLLGHSSPILTARYAALRPEDLEGQVAVLD